MIQVMIAIFALLAAVVTFKVLPKELGILRGAAAAVLVLVSLFSAASTSYVFVASDETGHLKKIYGSDELKNGRIIATAGEKGYQARILRPGFHFMPLVSVIYDIENLPIVNIPAGYYGRIETRDGKPLPEGAIMAAKWNDANFQKMLDATYFLTEGGQKGLQTAVLKPGRYPLNLYLYKVTVGTGRTNGVTFNMNGEVQGTSGDIDTRQTIIPAGHVGVVMSRISSLSAAECQAVDTTVKDADGRIVFGALSVPLVPNGCRGIWKDALRPGGYFLNRDAYDVTLVNTRVQTWRYAGGYTARTIDLTVEQDGTIKQEAFKKQVPVPENSADSAITVKVEGWTIHQNLRALVQITPENAPIVVAAVGGLKEVEDRVLTPAIIAEVRDVVGGAVNLPTGENDADGNMLMAVRPVRILDLVENRDFLQRAVDIKVREHGRKAGVNIMEVRFGNPDIPPEMLVARKREQLATQLKKAYAEERLAQKERQATEEARSRADKQSQLVQADINVDVAKKRKEEQEQLGLARKVFLEALAEGEKARVAVLGEDRVMMLNVVDKVLDALQAKPELVALVGKLVPNTVVMGGGGGLEGPMAILGAALGGGQMQTPQAMDPAVTYTKPTKSK